MDNQNNVLKLKLIKGENDSENIFTEGMVYGQYVFISQIFKEFEECEFHSRCRELFKEFMQATDKKPIKLSKETRKQISHIRKQFMQKEG